MIFASSPTPPTMLLDLSLMAILVIVAFAIVRMRSLFAIVMLQGVYSLVCAAWFVSLDAVDVAFTEAAVGAGVSTVLMLAAMLLADRDSEPVPVSKQIAPLIVVTIAGLAMFYAIGDMPAYGDVNSPANSYVGMEYMARTADEIHIPNVVTAVLGSYRGYDTFGEVVVIFAAGLGVLLLLGLNGNAGYWSATPNGQRLSAPSAPTADLSIEEDIPAVQAALEQEAKAKKVAAATKKRAATIKAKAKAKAPVKAPAKAKAKPKAPAKKKAAPAKKKAAASKKPAAPKKSAAAKKKTPAKKKPENKKPENKKGDA